MNTNRDLIKLSVILLLCVSILLIGGCNTTEPPSEQAGTTETLAPPGKNSVVTFPDGSKIIVRPETSLDVILLAGTTPGNSETRIRLNYGEIMVAPNYETRNWFTVINPGGYIARINGCAMTVSNNVILTNDGATGSFEIKCISGLCEFGPDENHLFPISILENATNVVSLENTAEKFDLGLLEAIYGADFPNCAGYVPPTTEELASQLNQQAEAEPQSTPMPSATQPILQPTGNFAATATASCLEFMDNFPGTPCP
jgi:hypothetical protein